MPYVELPGVHLWYHDTGGNGAPVVFMHAASGTCERAGRGAALAAANTSSEAAARAPTARPRAVGAGRARRRLIGAVRGAPRPPGARRGRATRPRDAAWQR